jgi:hypothetical protein
MPFVASLSQKGKPSCRVAGVKHEDICSPLLQYQYRKGLCRINFLNITALQEMHETFKAPPEINFINQYLSLIPVYSFGGICQIIQKHLSMQLSVPHLTLAEWPISLKQSPSQPGLAHYLAIVVHSDLGKKDWTGKWRARLV